MPDFRIIDTADEHPKLRQAGPAAVGLWAMAGARAMRDLTDGWVPEHYVLTWPNGKRHASTLVKVGLWFPEERRGVRGYRFHDWGQVQRTASQIETERARSRNSKAASRRSSRPSPSSRPPDVPEGVPPGHPRDTPRESDRDNNGTPAGSRNGTPPGFRRESTGSPYPQHPEGVAGGESSGRQRAGTATAPHPDDPQVEDEVERQPCGRRHDPAQGCGGCAEARRMREHAETEAEAAERAERAERARIAERCSCRHTGGWLEHPDTGAPVVRCDHETDPRQQLADALDHAS